MGGIWGEGASEGKGGVSGVGFEKRVELVGLSRVGRTV